MEKLIIIILSMLMLLFGIEILCRIKAGLTQLRNYLSSRFENKAIEDSFTPVEEPEEDVFDFGKYDVSAFRSRIEALKDEDGLYDIPLKKPPTDFTGIEIITESAELEKDRKIGR